MAYDWTCPEVLESFCKSRAGAQLAIPFDVIKNSPIIFEEEYEFKVNVVWAKPDGDYDHGSY